MSDHLHTPVVENIQQVGYRITCMECGLLLDFRSLEELDFKTDDWQVPDFEAGARTSAASKVRNAITEQVFGSVYRKEVLDALDRALGTTKPYNGAERDSAERTE